MKQSWPGQRGYALLIVLWTLAILALIVMRISGAGHVEAQFAQMARDAAASKAAADAAVQRAIFATLDPSSLHWNADHVIREMRIGGVSVAVRIDNEAGLVNPNLASPELLRALLLENGADAGTAATVAAGITEWRARIVAPVPPATARVAAVRSGDLPSSVAFTSVDDLSGLPGMTPALFERLRPHMTVFTDSDPDMSTHDPMVAKALAAAGESGGQAVETDLVSITADARGPGRARFAIRVVVQTNPQAEERHYRVLSYERLWNGMP